MIRIMIWAKDKSTGYIYRITEGTGDNLLQEDIDDGYVDYIYYDYYASYEDIKDDCAYDGGQILTKKLCADMSQQEFLGILCDFESIDINDLEILESNYDNR